MITIIKKIDDNYDGDVVDVMYYSINGCIESDAFIISNIIKLAWSSSSNRAYQSYLALFASVVY